MLEYIQESLAIVIHFGTLFLYALIYIALVCLVLAGLEHLFFRMFPSRR